jgi:leader peptidase (prepilin peptidase)/N-methyltransferase
MGMFGSFLGWKSALLIIMLGAIAGSVVGVTLILLRKHKAENVVPFGPFLAAGAVLTMLYGTDIVSWYLGLLRI